ncbi:MAG: DUF4268 domain-containing protein [Candidatus Binataceae bacterium]
MAVERLERIPLNGPESNAEYNEAWLQNLLYAHPEIIPVSEINIAFAHLVPIGTEVATASGPIDVLYATPTGQLVILEAKLWRNPEARRKVIGQILDYAKELSRSTYESLDARIRAARKAKSRGQSLGGLADVVRERYPDLDEARFIDAVSKCLQRGDFLLLIVGDGIREGVGAITEFLEGHGTLHFTFGLVEVAIYSMPDGSKLVQPRVLAQSSIIKRIVVSVEGSRAVVAEDATEVGATDEVSEEVLETRKRFEPFWDEFLKILRPRLQDQSQPLPDRSRSQSIYFYMPKPSHGWISGYVAQSMHRVGVYLTFERGPIGDRLYAALESDKALINRQLGVDVEWASNNGKHEIACHQEYSGIILNEHRNDAQEWLVDRVNRFITAFRPRMEQLLREQQIS